MDLVFAKMDEVLENIRIKANAAPARR